MIVGIWNNNLQFKIIKVIELEKWIKHHKVSVEQAGMGNDWKVIKRNAYTQKSVITIAKNTYDKTIQLKRCTEPTEVLNQIHIILKTIKTKPFKEIKFVVHKPSLKNNEIQYLQLSQPF